jgi:hypothetical protein
MTEDVEPQGYRIPFHNIAMLVLLIASVGAVSAAVAI